MLGQSSPDRIAHHRFSADVHQRLRPCFRRDDWHVFVALAEDWAIIVGAPALSLWAWGAWPIVPATVVYVLSVLVIGSRQRALATLLHDAAHGILARHRRLNALAGTLPAGYLIGQTLSGYRRSHVRRHHALFGDAVHDPDYAELRAAGLYGGEVPPECVRRHLHRLLHPASTWRYFTYLVRHRMFPRNESPLERVFRFGYLIGVAAVVVWTGHGVIALLYWLVPLLTTANWIGGLLELAEHYPYMELSTRIDVYMSRNRLCGPVANVVLGVHHEGYHLVHHLFPGMPSWHYPRAHRILMSDPVYASVNQVHGWAGILSELTLAPIRHPAWRALRAG